MSEIGTDQTQMRTQQVRIVNTGVAQATRVYMGDEDLTALLPIKALTLTVGPDHRAVPRLTLEVMPIAGTSYEGHALVEIALEGEAFREALIDWLEDAKNDATVESHALTKSLDVPMNEAWLDALIEKARTDD